MSDLVSQSSLPFYLSFITFEIINEFPYLVQSLSIYDFLPSHSRDSILERERVNSKIYAYVKSTLSAPFLLPQNLPWLVYRALQCTDLWKHRRNTDINIFVTIFMRKEKVMMVYISSVIRSDIDPEREITACLLATRCRSLGIR